MHITRWRYLSFFHIMDLETDAKIISMNSFLNTLNSFFFNEISHYWIKIFISIFFASVSSYSKQITLVNQILLQIDLT